MKQYLLLVEDEIDLGNVVKQYLEIKGFEVRWCQNASMAYAAFLRNQNGFGLILIDVQLPDMDGFRLAEKIVEKNKDQAFLFLTARNEKKDRIRGLELGADDYINKPFDIDELILRIKNIINRHEKTQSSSIYSVNEEGGIKLYSIGDIHFNIDLLRLILPSQEEVLLTLREAELLEYFFKNPNRILKREDILLTLWGENDYFLGRSLDVFISRLRKALNASSNISIENVYGVGFIFKVDET